MELYCHYHIYLQVVWKQSKFKHNYNLCTLFRAVFTKLKTFAQPFHDIGLTSVTLSRLTHKWLHHILIKCQV
jgi:hypothetical protein